MNKTVISRKKKDSANKGATLCLWYNGNLEKFCIQVIFSRTLLLQSSPPLTSPSSLGSVSMVVKAELRTFVHSAWSPQQSWSYFLALPVCCKEEAKRRHQKHRHVITTKHSHGRHVWFFENGLHHLFGAWSCWPWRASWPQGEGSSFPNRSGVPEVTGGLSERFLNYLRFL